MGLEKNAEKLDEYFYRLERGKAAKIKPSHVKKMIAKLLTKKDLLRAELNEAAKPSKRERIERKQATVRAQIERARWLLAQIST